MPTGPMETDELGCTVSDSVHFALGLLSVVLGTEPRHINASYINALTVDCILILHSIVEMVSLNC